MKKKTVILYFDSENVKNKFTFINSVFKIYTKTDKFVAVLCVAAIREHFQLFRLHQRNGKTNSSVSSLKQISKSEGQKA